MKLTTIFLLAATLVLCYCWTTDGHKYAGKNNHMRALQRNPHQGHHAVMMTGNSDRRLYDCKCVPRNHHQIQREKRHTKGHHKHNRRGRRCYCKKLNRDYEISIPLS